MSKPWRLTRQAEESLTEIARWTLEVFGPRQAAAYEQDLVERCTGIASGTVVSRNCRQLVDPELPENLRFCRCGGHFIVFLENTNGSRNIRCWQVIAFFPKRMGNNKASVWSKITEKTVLKALKFP